METQAVRIRQHGKPPLPVEKLEEFVIRYESGESVTSIAEDLGHDWHSMRRAIKRDYPELWERYQDCGEKAAETAAEEAAQIGRELAQAWRNREVQPEGSIAVKAAQVAINSLQWQAERRDPKRWGAKQSIEHSGGMVLQRGPDLKDLSQAQLEALAAIPDASEQTPL